MRKEYASHDAAGWIERNCKTTLSPLGREVAGVLSTAGGGIYNAPVAIQKINWDNAHYIEVYWRGDLSNWDSPALSILLVECHRRLLRVNIQPSNPQGVKLIFHKRSSREGGMGEGLPTLKTVDEMVAGWYGEQP